MNPSLSIFKPLFTYPKTKNVFMELLLKRLRAKNIVAACVTLTVLWAMGFAQQWGGGADQNGNIYRSGYVGIGVTNPDRKLTIKSGLAQSSSGENACSFDMYVGAFTVGSGPRIDFTHNLNTKMAAIRSYIFGNANTGLAFETGWSTNSAVNMVIDGSGKVGIGTTNPDRKLTIKSGLAQSSSGENACNFDMYVGDFTVGSGPRIDFTHNLNTKMAAIRSYIFGNANTGLAFETGWSTNSAVNMVIDGSGNVGIRTTSPQAELDVNGLINANDISVGTIESIDLITGHITGHSGLTLEGGNMVITGEGKVGIGTTTPDRKLTIKSGLAQSSSGENACNFDMNVGDFTVGSGPRIDFTHQLTTKLAAIRSYIFGNANTGLAFETGWSTNSAVNMVIDGSGKVGIGTTTPDRKLTIKSGLAQSSSGENACNFDMYVGDFTVGSGPRIDFTHNLNTKIAAIRSYIFGNANTGLAFETGWSTNSAVNMVIDGDGNVGIGTTNPQAALDVKGSIIANGGLKLDSGDLEVSHGIIRVKNWTIEPADYVFEDSYKLPTLDEVEKFVKENKHLADVPSAKEMKTKGLDLTEMNMRLLKKVEELTLYSIEQNKRIEALEKAVEKAKR